MGEGLTHEQIGICINILKAAKVSLSNESTDDYIAAANFVFEKGLMFYPGVALLELEAAYAARPTQERT